MPKRAARPVLEDMLAYAEEAQEMLGGRDGGELRADRLRLLAVTRAVEIVGEAANQLADDVVDALGFDLRPAIAMRHRLIHGYDSASADTIARTIQEDFPELILAVRRLLASALPDET
jgi:uncharacterized protein with HEPN domain